MRLFIPKPAKLYAREMKEHGCVTIENRVYAFNKGEYLCAIGDKVFVTTLDKIREEYLEMDPNDDENDLNATLAIARADMDLRTQEFERMRADGQQCNDCALDDTQYCCGHMTHCPGFVARRNCNE